MDTEKIRDTFWGCLIWLAFFGAIAGIAGYCENKEKEAAMKNAAQPAMAFVISGDKHLHTTIHGFMATNAEIKLLSKQDVEKGNYILCRECTKQSDIVDTFESIEQSADNKYKEKSAVQTLFDKWEKEDQGEEPVYVWICTGSSSHAYHSDPDCEGLQYCKADIEEIELEDAEDMGRTPCHFCHDED